MVEPASSSLIDLSTIPELSKLDARVPNWDIQALRTRACPICRLPGPAALKRPDGLPVSYCPDCALWYVSGMPPDADIYALYQDYWSGYRPKQMDVEGGRVVREAAKTTASIDLKAQRLTALLGTLKGKLILEVGAGRGEFLAAVRYAGAEVIANEISPEACHFLERVLRIPVVRGELAEICWNFDPPDVIVMSDLLEHPIEPFKLLSRAVGLLRKGGQLVIWTPNGGGAGQDAATAAGWVGFRVDLEHLQYFSPKTIQILAGRWGLQINHLETTGYPGLSGIGRLPMKGRGSAVHKLATWTKAAIKRAAPWLTQIKQIATDLQLPRIRGNYHLFAILTKG